VSTPAPYPFKELPKRHIRVLELQPGDRGSPLHGSLRNVCIDDSVSYEALSYTWGAPGTSSFIHCDGFVVPLTLNLDLALSRLRLPDETRIIWIDQICINQNDDFERGRQVSLMGEIYRKARAVDIWLGEEDENTHMVVSAIPDILQSFDDPKEIDENGDEIPRVIKNLGILFIRSRRWNALKEIFERPYFRRVWIVQEVALGADCHVYCGSFAMPWSDLAKAAICLNIESGRQIEAHRVLGMIRGLKRKIAAGENRTLLELLYQSYNLQCSNPRDKIYGTLGLVSDYWDEDLIPNYTSSCQATYSAVTRLCMRRYNSLAILCLVRHPKCLDGLPSWVPDWTSQVPLGETCGFRYAEKYSAAGTTHPKLTILDDDETLVIQGKRIDTIRNLGNMMPLDNGRPQIYEEWRNLTRTLSPYFTNETYPTIFWRIFSADGRTRGKESDRIREQLYKAHNYLVERNWNLANGIPDDQDPGEEMSIINTWGREFEALIDAGSYGRRITATKKYFLGLVPADTQIGDLICIFEGGQVPFVLRKSSSEDNNYSLIGECYLQGWMDGSGYENLQGPVEEFAII
jgi:hypothetical protein